MFGRGVAERGESTQAFRELDPKASHFKGGPVQNTPVRRGSGRDVSLSRKLQWTASISMPHSNVNAHGRREHGKDRGRQRQSKPAADKGSGTGTRQANRRRPRHTQEVTEKESHR